jgi:hypothetical protein
MAKSLHSFLSFLFNLDPLMRKAGEGSFTPSAGAATKAVRQRTQARILNPT